jgi:phosphoglycerate dehydrogenase-like enzyme
MVDAQALALLPPHAQLVNVSRGEIVDQPALIEALRAGRLAGAFLDVFAQEPLPADSPLWSLPNVIVTPHSAGISDGNAARVQRMFLDNLQRWRAGEPLHHCARP